jgi:hypothetical protein
MEEWTMVRSARRLAIAAGGGVGVAVVVLMILVVPSAATPSGPAVVQAVTLQNPGFEGGMGNSQVYWTRDDGGPFFPGVDPGIPRRDNIKPPEGWTAWWRDKYPCDLAYTFNMAQPEMVVIGDTDPARVYEGDQAFKSFTFHACHDMGILQTVSAVPGGTYHAEAMGHAWYSDCDSKPHDPPLLPNCEDPWGFAHDYLSVGIDPTGGIDPLGPDVVWGQEVEIYGVYDHSITVTAKAEANQITLFLRSRADTPLKHDDAYWDSVSLEEYPVLEVEQDMLVYLAELGGADPAPRWISVITSTPPLTWTAIVSPTVGWLTVSDLSGTTPSVVTATASVSGLGIGVYSTEIIIESDDALSGSPQTIPVVFAIADEIHRAFLPLLTRDG